MTIHVVGGIYHEWCVHPNWNRIYGSGGRAALTIGHMGTPVMLHAYADQESCDAMNEEAAWLDNVSLRALNVPSGIGFRYMHDLDTPGVSGAPPTQLKQLTVAAEKAVRFDMIECDAKVTAKWAVYDPQGARAPVRFDANGSRAEHLALVLNTWEASTLAGLSDAPPSVTAPLVAEHQNAEVVVVKMGPQGAYVWTLAESARVPAHRTSHVWKIGSGDCFVAHFANAWMHDGKSPVEAAAQASLATAYYCEHRAFATREQLVSYAPPVVQLSPAFLCGEPRQVYLAGPFFDLAQLWLVEEALHDLAEVGLKVFSPYHRVGIGSFDDVVPKDLDGIRDSDLVFAITDGLDAGTLYEIGYARAIGKPVIVYSERHAGENLRMMEGSGCVMCDNYATAIYSALWEAVRI